MEIKLEADIVRFICFTMIGFTLVGTIYLWATREQSMRHQRAMAEIATSESAQVIQASMKRPGRARGPSGGQ